MKRGLFTGYGRDYCGEIIFNDLIVPGDVYQQVKHGAELLDDEISLATRRRTMHKGNTGHLLIVGGDHGMPGAVLMAAKAALRTGAGRVTVVTRQEHAAALVSNQPEIMVHGMDDEQDIPESLLDRVNVIAIGPGLGRQNWGNRLLNQVLDTEIVKVIDADALVHLVHIPANLDRSIITPHPGEAAILLDSSVAEIEQNRFRAIEQLCEEYGAITVLKGAGTLVYDGMNQVHVCPFGNPGMATAGMGDILTGIIAGLVAQGVDARQAALSGVCLHGLAGDDASHDGERGMVATDLLPFLRQRVNPSCPSF
jgi:NAD(P)H-hydrate epimerase